MSRMGQYFCDAFFFCHCRFLIRYQIIFPKFTLLHPWEESLTGLEQNGDKNQPLKGGV